MSPEPSIRLARACALSAVAALLASCTLITNGRIEDVIRCDGMPDGTVCGNQYDDGIARVCMAGVCVPDSCGDADAGCGALDTRFTSRPGAISAPDVTFQFEATVLSATYECSLDGADFEACASPHALAGLAAGEHTFRVRARTEAGDVDPTPAEHSWTVDPVLLDTVITMGPGATTGPEVSFEFSGNQTVSFECRLAPVDAAFAPCASPQTYVDLAERTGGYTFYVRGVRADGAFDATPAEQSFDVDATGPGVGVLGSPAAGSAVDTTWASFTFATIPAGEASVQFACRFDDEADFADCTSGFARNGLAHGAHTLRVRAIDRFGNEGPIVTHAWSVSLVDTWITSGPSGATGPDVSFAFGGSQAASFECRLAPVEAEFTACTSPRAYDDLAEIAAPGYTFTVRGVGADGAVDATPPARTFAVDATGPGVVVSGAPAAGSTVGSASASFSFTPVPSDEPQVDFLCRFHDEADFTDCTGGFERTNLALGAQTLEVKAVDRFGNEGAVVTRSWTTAWTETSIYAIRTAPVAPGTRVRVAGAGASRVRMTRALADRFFAQETDGASSPDYKGITVYPDGSYDPDDVVSGRPVVVVGTVQVVDGNTALVDAEFFADSTTSLALSPRETNGDVNALHQEANEGLLVRTAGEWDQDSSPCSYTGAFDGHIVPCSPSGTFERICPVFVGYFQGIEQEYHFEGVLEGDGSSGYALRVYSSTWSSTACF